MLENESRSDSRAESLLINGSQIQVIGDRVSTC